MHEKEQLENLGSSVATLRKTLAQRIVGQHEVITDLLACFLAGGHCILVGVPGLAKTMLVHSLAECLDLQFNRIQFTPDLMPSDITGSEILFEDRATGNREFRFVKGPVFSNIVLADEINRTPPKTQSALLQAMQEREVTSSGQTFPLPKPFWVLATQNPIEQEGTYPLPEAQLDRFMFNLWLDYPSFTDEMKIAESTTSEYKPTLNKVINAKEIINFQDLVRKVPVAENVIKFAVEIVSRTRPTNNNSPEFIKHWISWGAGPRASQYLLLAAKTRAITQGRFTPNIDDIKSAMIPVLRHRIITNFNAEAEGISSIEVIKKLIAG